MHAHIQDLRDGTQLSPITCSVRTFYHAIVVVESTTNRPILTVKLYQQLPTVTCKIVANGTKARHGTGAGWAVERDAGTRRTKALQSALEDMGVFLSRHPDRESNPLRTNINTPAESHQALESLARAIGAHGPLCIVEIGA